ncbi:pyridoxal phosphate-dependent aminotransferase [Oligoflexia bacterium]|nr:pyridoxal phosphate-dependent aminotransferase [Oligoflexia bacterium]
MSFHELVNKTLKLQAAGQKLISLNLGKTNLDAPACAIKAVSQCIQQQRVSYGPPAGFPAFLEAVAKREDCAVDQIVVGPGSKYLLFALMSTILKKGDKVLIPSPLYPVYNMICEQLGLELVLHHTTLEDSWHFGDLSLDGIKLLLICNPLNPTSTIYPETSVLSVIAEAKSKGIPVVLDEAYKSLAFTPLPNYQDAMHIRSFSKEFNLEGWRLGYLVAPEDIAKRVTVFNQKVITCVPEFVQLAGQACLENEDRILKVNLACWKERLAFAQQAFSKLGFRFAEPQAGMYLFASHPEIKDVLGFTMRLLDQGVAISPGEFFGGA